MGFKAEISELVESFKLSLEDDPTSSKPLNALIMLEEALIAELRTSTNTDIDNVLKDEIDTTLIENGANTINQYLDQISDAVERVLDEDSESLDNLLKRLKVFYKKIKSVIIKSMDAAFPEGPGTKKSERKEYGTKKLKLLIKVLRKYKIYTDDILIIAGENKPEMARDGSYLIIEIPKFNRTILLHPGYGEASFVIKGIHDRLLYDQLTKIELVEKLKARKIIFDEQNIEEWMLQIIEALDIYAAEEKTDINLEDFDRRQFYISELRKLYPTPEIFMRLKHKTKLKIKINEFGLGAIAGFITGISCLRINSNRRDTAILAKEVYGEGHEIIEAELWDCERWIKEFKKKYPKPEDCLELGVVEIAKIIICGKGIDAIKNRISGNKKIPKIKSKRDFALFAEDIYGKGHKIIEKYLEKNESEDWSMERWFEEIKKVLNTPEKFMALTHLEVLKINIGNTGIHTLATLLLGGSGHQITSSKSSRALFARKVFGDGHDIIDSEIFTVQEWIARVKQEYPNPVSLWQMNTIQRQNLKIATKNLIFICRIVLPEQSDLQPLARLNDFKTLLYAIYGEEIKLPEPKREIKENCLTKAEILDLVRETNIEGENDDEKLIIYLITEFKKEYPEPEDFMNASFNDMKQFNINGWGLTKIAKIILGKSGLKIAGDKKHKAELASKIYGEGYEVIECVLWDAEQWKKFLRSKYMIDELINFMIGDKRAYIFYKFGPNYFYSLLYGENDDNVYKHEFWVKLVAGIYDEDYEKLITKYPKARGSKNKY